MIFGAGKRPPQTRPGRRILLAVILSGLLLAGRPGRAVVSGPCSDCHTMHYSQNGGVLSEWGPNGPYQALLVHDCVGCHTGSNTSGGEHLYVFDPNGPVYGDTGTGPTSSTLAGGDFYWVTGSDSCGHNVSGIAAADAALATPPGFDGGRPAGDGSIPGNGSWPSGTQITCAGTYGCHGSHTNPNPAGALRGGHHGISGPAITNPRNDASDYRMLVGIAGYEDPEREFRPEFNRHNQYKGIDNPESSDTSTISSLCARCHGLFHDDVTDSSASPWLRHPVNYDLGRTPTNSEYRNYGGTGHLYQVATPVGSADVSQVLGSVTFNDDTIITCLSCHRAHGSPFYKSLRWDYRGSVTGGYCGNCHTTKD
jgi:hypothetical protein